MLRVKSLQARYYSLGSLRSLGCGAAGLRILIAAITSLGLSEAAFSALSASPNPNTGSYTVTWSAGSGSVVWTNLEEKVPGSIWTVVANGASGSWSTSGKSPGSYQYRRVDYVQYQECIEYPTRFCWGAVGESPSSPITVTVNPPAPATPSAITGPSSDSDGSFSLSWGSSSGATNYTLQRRLGSGSWTTVQNTSATSRSESGLGSGTYSYRVRACNASGCSGWTASKTVTVTLPPATPSAIGAPSSDSDGAFSLSWGSSSGATSYTLQRRIGSGSWSTVQNTSATSRSESGLGSGTYSYRVRACNASGCSGWTATKTVTVTLPPATPSAINGPSTDTDGAFTLSWGSSSGATSYTLQRRIGSGGWSTIQNSSAASRNESGLSSATYSYRVRACNAGGCSGWTATKSVTVTLPPVTPSAITGPSTDADGSFTVSWGSSSSATSYQLQRRVDSGGWASIQNASGTSRSESSIADGVWQYRVRACSAAGCSGWTGVKTVTVARTPGVPGAISGPDAGSGNPTADYTLSWGAAVGSVTSYELQESVGSTSAWSTLQNSAATSRSFIDVPLGNYYYRARACNTVGSYNNCGAWTAIKVVDVLRLTNAVLTAPANSVTGAYEVSWSNITGGGRLLLQQTADGGISWTTAYNGIGVPGSFAFSGKADGSYSYRIKELVGSPGNELELYSQRVTVVVGMIPEPPITTTTVAGNVPYETGVTKGGNAYVTIPIAAVPGVNGLEPGLGITYNSGRDRQRIDQDLPGDTLGYGFSLSGFASIRRCVKNEPAPASIQLGSSDRLCLNGEPLVLTAGSYLQPGSEYRTLRESYHKIVMRDGTVAGPWFEVFAPDGSVVQFGNTDDSRIRNVDYVTVNGDTQEVLTVPYLWSVSRHEDAFGNVMTYNYYKDELAGVNHPANIVYGFNGDAKIQFEYIGRDDLDPVQLGDATLEQPLLLHTVRVTLSGQKVREYTLESETSPAPDQWRRLNRVQLCGYDENGVTSECLNPLDFDWAEPSQSLPDLKTYVQRVTDSQGRVTEFTQDTITTGNNPFLFGERPFGNGVLPADTQAVPASNGNIKSVITEVRRGDGIGGWHRTSYAYHGPALESTRNWGYLGFYGSRVTDQQSGIVTYHQYRLDFPHFAEVAATRQYDANFGSHTELLTRTETRFAALEKTYGSKKTYLPYEPTVTSSLLEGGTEIGVVQTSNVPSSLDGNGLMTSLDNTTVVAGSKQVASAGGSFWGDVPTYTLSNVKRSVVTAQDFDNDLSGTNWLIGFRDNVATRHYRGPVASGPLDQTQTATYTRHAGSNEIGTEIRFPGDADLALTTSYGYDSRGNLTTETVSGAHVASRTSSANNHVQGRYPTFVRNALSHDTDLVFDGRFGLPKSVIDPNNRQTSIVYDGFGREVRRTTPDNVVITTSYARCADVSCASVGGIAPVTRIQTSSAISPTIRRYLDSLGREIRSEVESLSGAYIRQDTEYDNQGRVDRVSQPYLTGGTAHFVSYDYDIRNRIEREDRPDGSHTMVTYAVESGVGVSSTITEEINDAAGSLLENRVKVSVFNLTGELVTNMDAHGSSKAVTTSYEYYASGLPKTVIVTPGGANLTTSYVFDDAGNRISIAGPDIGTVSSQYTALGLLRKQTDNAGNVLEWGYDLLNRLDMLKEGTTSTTPTTTATWSYDPTNGTGLLHQRKYNSTEFVETFAYGSDARPSAVTTAININGQSKSYTHSITYKSDGRTDTVTYPSGIQVQYGYSRGYLSTVTDTATSTALQTFSQMDAFGNVKQESYGNGIQTSRAFDSKTGRLTDIDTTLGGTTFQDNQYKWQSNGILESRIQVDGATTREEDFSYDTLDRLEKSQTFVNSVLSRTLDTDFDIRGNIESKISSVTGDIDVTNYQYATGKNRLDGVSIDGVGYTLGYDANGSITEYDRSGSGDDRYIAWNRRNLPEKVVVGDSLTDPTPTASDEFAYGPDGQRFYKKSIWDDGGTQKVEHTFYVGSFEELVTDPSDTAVKEVHKSRIGDSILHIKSVDRSNVSSYAIEYLHRDHLGSVEKVTDSSGSELRVLAYDPFGERRKDNWLQQLDGAETDALADDLRMSTSRGFTGHENLDRTGFIHMNGRIYDPQLGRFLSPDPIVQAPAFSQSWNRYSYVMNSPMSYTDPSGYVRQSASGLCQPPVCLNANNPSGGAAVGGSASAASVPFTAYDIFFQIVTVMRPTFGGYGGGFGGGLGGDCYDCGGAGFFGGYDFGGRMSSITMILFGQSITIGSRAVAGAETGETDESILERANAAFARLAEIQEFSDLVKMAERRRDGRKVSIAIDRSVIGGATDGENNRVLIDPNFADLGYESEYRNSEEFRRLADPVWNDDSIDYNAWEEEHLAANQYFRFTLERIIYHEVRHLAYSGLENDEQYVIDATNEFMRKHFGEKYPRRNHRSVICSEVKCN